MCQPIKRPPRRRDRAPQRRGSPRGGGAADRHIDKRIQVDL